jgi:hypothetical protein
VAMVRLMVRNVRTLSSPTTFSRCPDKMIFIIINDHGGDKEKRKYLPLVTNYKH